MNEPRPRTRVVHLDSPRARWEWATAEPAPDLRGDVVGYHGYVEETPGGMRRRELPTGEVVLILPLDSPTRMTDPRAPHVTDVVRRAFVAGVGDAYTLTELGPGWTGVQVNFSPLGAYRCFGVPMHELTNRVVELADLLGAEGRRLEERIAEAGSWEAKFAALDALLAERMRTGPAPSERVAAVWRRLHDPGAEIGALARAVGWSRKHLIASFHWQVGLPPGRLARLLRFRRAVRLLGDATAPDWSALALRCGYYDQAHMIRDFRDFAGAAPGEFLRRRLPDGGGVDGAEGPG